MIPGGREAFNSVRSDTGVGGRNPSPLNEHRPPRRETAAPLAQTEKKRLNHQSALFLTREFVLQGRIHEKGFLNWKDNWKARGRFMRCSTSTHPFKDIPEDRKVPTGGGGLPPATSEHRHATTLQHSQKSFENF